MGFSRRKIPRSSIYTISKKATWFRHGDYDLDRAQQLISSSMSRHLSTCNISFKSMHVFLANRQTDRQTMAKTCSFVRGNELLCVLQFKYLYQLLEPLTFDDVGWCLERNPASPAMSKDFRGEFWRTDVFFRQTWKMTVTVIGWIMLLCFVFMFCYPSDFPLCLIHHGVLCVNFCRNVIQCQLRSNPFSRTNELS